MGPIPIFETVEDDNGQQWIIEYYSPLDRQRQLDILPKKMYPIR
jgi:hypothetical protein